MNSDGLCVQFLMALVSNKCHGKRVRQPCFFSARCKATETAVPWYCSIPKPSTSGLIVSSLPLQCCDLLPVGWQKAQIKVLKLGRSSNGRHSPVVSTTTIPEETEGRPLSHSSTGAHKLLSSHAHDWHVCRPSAEPKLVQTPARPSDWGRSEAWRKRNPDSKAT